MIFDALVNSLLIGIGTVAVNMLFAVPLAWLVHRTDLPGKSLVVTLVAISILIPGFLKAMGWILMLSPDIGLLNSLYVEATGAVEAPFTIYGMGGVVFIQGLMLTPAMFFLVSGSMIALDPALEEAAQMSGASRWLTIARVSFPLIRPAVFAGLIYNFMTAVTLYEIAALLLDEDTAVLSTELFLYVRSAGGSIELGYAAVYGVNHDGLRHLCALVLRPRDPQGASFRRGHGQGLPPETGGPRALALGSHRLRRLLRRAVGAATAGDAGLDVALAGSHTVLDERAGRDLVCHLWRALGPARRVGAADQHRRHDYRDACPGGRILAGDVLCHRAIPGSRAGS